MSVKKPCTKNWKLSCRLGVYQIYTYRRNNDLDTFHFSSLWVPLQVRFLVGFMKFPRHYLFKWYITLSLGVHSHHFTGKQSAFLVGLKGWKVIDFEYVILLDRWILQESRLHAKHRLQKRKEESNLQLSRFQPLSGYISLLLKSQNNSRLGNYFLWQNSIYGVAPNVLDPCLITTLNINLEHTWESAKTMRLNVRHGEE